ncbi:MAG: Wzz/FepE/Etk N-terminal domain-containing protein [Cellulophaga sp.]
MNEYEDEFVLMDYLNIIWKRKWIIIIPTLFLVIVVGIISFLLPPKWEIDAIIAPGKFLIQNQQGGFKEIMVVDPKQIANQINEKSYDYLIATELNLDIMEFPKLKAENIRDTKLVQISIKENDVEKAKLILHSLFNRLNKELDKKIDVEIKGIDIEIANNKNLIKQKELDKKNKLGEIKFNQIEKNKTRQEMISGGNKLKISEERVKSIMDELKAVKKRIDELERLQREALAGEKEGISAISLLLYSNEVQQNLRYYNTLDEKLSNQKIIQENLSLSIKEKNEEIKQFDIQIERIKTEINKINNEIDIIKNNIEFLNKRKARIDYTQLIKEPTSSLRPVNPKNKLNILIAGILGLMAFTMLAFFLESLEKQKTKSK